MSEKINKYTYEIVLQGNYGYGWDDEIYCDDYKDAREQLKTYRENVRNASFRIINRREINPEWEKKMKENNSLSGRHIRAPAKKCPVKINFKKML